MQSECKDIYKLTSDRTGKSLSLYKDVGNFVFAALYNHMRRPESLIIKLKGIGSWHLRKTRMEIILKNYPVDYTKDIKDFTTDLAFLKYENKLEIHDLFKERLKDYDKYLKLRDEIRAIRYKTQFIIESKKEE